VTKDLGQIPYCVCLCFVANFVCSAHGTYYIVLMPGPCQHVVDVNDRFLNSISINTCSVDIYAGLVFVYTFITVQRDILIRVLCSNLRVILQCSSA
jgi:hypothetical protein